MDPAELEALKYPTGKLEWEKDYSMAVIQSLIDKIEKQPDNLREVVQGISADNQNYSYRPGGWTIRQIIHHVSDSHLNAYIRTKLALTEDCPTIKPYDENKWADLFDTAHADFLISVHLLDTIHKRWVILLRSLKREDFDREYFHPEMKRKVPLTHLLSIYAWHGDHHIGQIRGALKNKF